MKLSGAKLWPLLALGLVAAAAGPAPAACKFTKLGMDFLLVHRVIVDRVHNRLYVTRNAAPDGK